MKWNDITNVAKKFAFEGWTSYASIAVGLVVLLGIIGFTMQYVVQTKAERFTQTHLMTDKQVACSIVGSTEKQDFLNSQRREITAFANSHRDSAVSFFAYFYVTYLVFTIFGLLAAISLAIITKSGISAASPHLIAVFLICTAIVVLYQGAFAVFQQKSNIDNNAKLSISYAILADQIDTYCVTGKINVTDPNEALADAFKATDRPSANANASAASTPASAKEAPINVKIRQFYAEPTGDQFINYVSWQIEHLRNFAIVFDDTKVSSVDTKRFMFQ
jgi:hypothetical protein